MAVELRNVSKTYVQRGNGSTRRILALAPLTLTVEKGEFFAIIGPSGCGKSSLLNLIAGFERPDTGEVLVEGKRVERPGPDRAVVFQEAGLMPWMTVLGNVEYGLKLRGIPKTERRERAMHFLKMVHLSKYAHALPHELSGGMRQRVSIARALALEPNVLLMDEPFSALDAQTRDVLHDELQRIWFETHVTIIFVTHNINEAVYLADRVLIMTAPPGSIKRLVRVPFARPRVSSSADLRVFAGQLHTSIREEVEKVAAREFDEDWTPELQVQPTPDPASGI
ncbi:MAG: ABC transporter ATP-binding protein [Candidatus Hydrogenedentota bacterium]|uniref:ABC-type probable sulfate transporter, ATPase component n=1 Tax=Sumerlaea chitinivorans TaxID=2250252 RepID=A0A2Z4Y426_SUMC1|nr:ABC-type probable sulfate transporter, ATPase component [Candidatus Sumerlaea chitinivorans]RMH25907.1 MAG: ABC transporter ATP-binding protein [Candidatus Hydrogenedentota bacterium]GIX45469.1 MAG: nitrate/sulfonate/bicarbonate ABC transporter ATP-binding protein [Candidatus Sumerlaea sp.]